MADASDAAGSGSTEPPRVSCKDCAEGYLWSGTSSGVEVTLGGLPTYHAAPAPESQSSEPSAAILFIHDGFGWKFPNNRILCDQLAKLTCVHVYMPDFYDGIALVTEEQAQAMLDPQPSFLGNVVASFKLVISIPSMLMTIQKFNASRTQPLMEKVVEGLVQKHGGEKCKVGAVGYCWGGKYALRLGAQGRAAACVACHPSMVDVAGDELRDMRAACLFLRAAEDFVFPESLWKQTESAIKEAGAELDFTVYPGTKHGFAVRCNEADTVACKARDEALTRTVDWFVKHLK